MHTYHGRQSLLFVYITIFEPKLPDVWKNYFLTVRRCGSSELVRDFLYIEQIYPMIKDLFLWHYKIKITHFYWKIFWENRIWNKQKKMYNLMKQLYFVFLLSKYTLLIHILFSGSSSRKSLGRYTLSMLILPIKQLIKAYNSEKVRTQAPQLHIIS